MPPAWWWLGLDGLTNTESVWYHRGRDYGIHRLIIQTIRLSPGRQDALMPAPDRPHAGEGAVP